MKHLISTLVPWLAAAEPSSSKARARLWLNIGFASLAFLSGFAQEASPPLAKVPTVNEEIRRAVAGAPLKLQFHGSSPAELTLWQQEFSAKLRGLIGPHTPPKEWKVKVLSTHEFPDHTREELLLESDAAPSLPLYILRPRASAEKRFPIVLCLHGHGEFGHDAVAGVDDTPALKEEIRKMNYDYGRQLVRQGYFAVVPCFTPFGRRLDASQRNSRTDACAVEFVRLMYLGRTLLGENLRDAMWALDYATTRADARADRVGCVGLSYGGRMAMMVAALDPRVPVAVISGALNVFQERIQGAGFCCGAQVIPGLLEIGDTPEIGSLIAPRPTIWEAGRQDTLMVPGWLEKASERIQRAYTAAGEPGNFEVHRFDGGHVWNGETAIPLLAKVLKDP